MSDDIKTETTVLAKYAAFQSAHTDKVMAYNRTDVMAEVQRALVTYVPGAIEAAQTERETRENVRAVRRNRNRILTLLVVLAMELVVPTLALRGWLPAFFVKYEVLAITAPDALLTMYAYFRKY